MMLSCSRGEINLYLFVLLLLVCSGFRTLSCNSPESEHAAAEVRHNVHTWLPLLVGLGG